jgi:hypothetical protein
LSPSSTAARSSFKCGTGGANAPASAGYSAATSVASFCQRDSKRCTTVCTLTRSFFMPGPVLYRKKFPSMVRTSAAKSWWLAYRPAPPLRGLLPASGGSGAVPSFRRMRTRSMGTGTSKG